jgi:prepilin-type N-terminal cleavage/methylation domain-containing protein
MFRLKRNKGFSLLELIITITVLTVVMAAMTVLMVRMTGAATDQRRNQAQNIAQEQARMALLSMVRDARLSHTIVTSGTNTLTLHATTRGGQPVVITYSATTNATADIYTGNNVLHREMTINGVATTVVGDGENQWPNSFSAAPLEQFITSSTPSGHLNIDLTLWLPVYAGDVVDPADPADDGFRTWEIGTTVATNRNLF